MAARGKTLKRPRADVSSFVSITGADEGYAARFLEAFPTVEAAVQAYFEQDNDGPVTAAGSGMPAVEAVRAPDMEQHVRLSDESAPAMHGLFQAGPVIVNSFGSVSAGRGRPDAKQTKIAQLYRTPEELLFVGSFAEAKESAASRSLWLLVNIQDLQEFDSQLINRDVWNNEDVRDLVSSMFVFWQQLHSTPAGSRFMQLHKINKSNCPYVAILDPHTGENLWNHSGRLSRDEFFTAAYDFLGTHKLGEEAAGPVPVSTEAKPSKQRRKRVDHDEEALAAAMRESSGASPDPAPPVTVVVDMSDDEAVEEAPPARKAPRPLGPVVAPPPLPAPAGFESAVRDALPAISPVGPSGGGTGGSKVPFQDPLTVSVSPEPAPGPGVCRIQLRLSDGGRIIRRFSEASLVRDVFAFVSHHLRSIGAPVGQRFELSLPHASNSKLSSCLDTTLREAGLSNSVVIVQIQ